MAAKRAKDVLLGPVPKLRVAIIVNTLANKGGIERIVLYLWKRYKADIFTGHFDPDSTFEELRHAKVAACIHGKRQPRGGALKMARWFRALDMQGKYDVFINIGGFGAVNAVTRHHPQILYACMPIAWLYHRYDQELERHPALTRPLWHVFFSLLRWYDRRLTRRFDGIYVISRTTQENFRKYLGVGSEVIYPPTDISTYWCGLRGDYYIYVGRLTPAKRPQTVLETFRNLPHLKLKIVGNGEMLDELRRIAPPNVEVVGPVTEKRLRELYSRCVAAVYVSTREDYGYIPIEANASGRPCIATNEGGFRETIIHKKTGLLVDNPTPDSVAAAVRWLTPKRAWAMRDACLRQAPKFSLNAFFRQMDDALVRIAGKKR
jgi:glycosyltransferase involved in cell wall biosynthesis